GGGGVGRGAVPREEGARGEEAAGGGVVAPGRGRGGGFVALGGRAGKFAFRPFFRLRRGPPAAITPPLIGGKVPRPADTREPTSGGCRVPRVRPGGPVGGCARPSALRGRATPCTSPARRFASARCRWKKRCGRAGRCSSRRRIWRFTNPARTSARRKWRLTSAASPSGSRPPTCPSLHSTSVWGARTRTS